MQTEDKKEHFAFVIMPFHPEFDNIYTEFVMPALKSVGYDVSRADNVIDQQNILKDIIHGIHKADLIIAEITSLNPNVLYELGIAHGLLRPTVMLTQNIEDVPFDLRSYRSIIYSTHYIGIKKLHDELRSIALKHKDGLVSFGNPVSDFSPGTIPQHKTADQHYESMQKVVSTEISEQQEEAEEGEGEDEEQGILDFVADGEHSLNEITARIETLGKMAVKLSNDMEVRTAEALSTKDDVSPGSAGRMRRIATAIASDMTEYANNVEAELPALHNAWEQLLASSTDFLSSVSIESSEDRKAMLTLHSNMESFKDAITHALAAARSGQEATQQMKGLSKNLNQAVNRQTRATNGVIEELVTGESHIARLINIINERLDEQQCGS